MDLIVGFGECVKIDGRKLWNQHKSNKQKVEPSKMIAKKIRMIMDTAEVTTGTQQDQKNCM
jgi:hypothetical protein